MGYLIHGPWEPNEQQAASPVGVPTGGPGLTPDIQQQIIILNNYLIETRRIVHTLHDRITALEQQLEQVLR